MTKRTLSRRSDDHPGKDDGKGRSQIESSRAAENASAECSMVERVAKAKWARRVKVGLAAGIFLNSWENELEALRDEVRAEVRCGIAAMREANQAMVEAGRWPAEDDGPVGCWAAMISAALEENSVAESSNSVDPSLRVEQSSGQTLLAERDRLRGALVSLLDDKHITYGVRVQIARAALHGGGE